MTESHTPTLEEHLAHHAEANANDAAPVTPAKTKNPWQNNMQQDEQRYVPMTLETILDFGKYAGNQVEDMIYDQPGYIRWIHEKTDRNFSEEVLELMQSEGII